MVRSAALVVKPPAKLGLKLTKPIATRALVGLAMNISRERSLIVNALGFAVEAGNVPEVIRQAERLVDRKLGCKKPVCVDISISVWKLLSGPIIMGSVGSERSLPVPAPESERRMRIPMTA